MPFTVDDFFDLLAAASGETVDGLTDALDSIAKSERGRSEDLFSTVIDQVSFNTDDYDRLRKFLIDWYSAFKAIGTASSTVSDPNSLTNTDLDELFRSFGYNHSTILKDFDENPLPTKVNFFLDLVNLYKRKGTPQTIIDVLQYYGIPELDVYEFFLKFNQNNDLIFDGVPVAGTSESPTTIELLWPELTRLDPHWLQTEAQIRALHRINAINLPSKTPYFGIQPVADADGPEMAILSRLVQDQYVTWAGGGTLEDNAAITIIGENHSLLELYLSAIYMFNKQYDVGVAGDRFLCYDGTSTSAVDIIAEFQDITQRPLTRQAILDQLAQYYDQFTRAWPRNFLQPSTNKDAAVNALIAIDPGLKASLDSLGDTDEVILFSLLKDIAIWVRNNIGFGFVNLGFIAFGLDAFFEDLKPVINFFKPYRARFILLETLQMKNRLFNTIVTEDDTDLAASFRFYDYLTGDSIPCCNERNIDSTDSETICLDSTSGLHYTRDTYDCGSYHDIGAVTDLPQGDTVFIESRDEFHDALHCPQDSTGFISNHFLVGDEDDLPIPYDSSAFIDNELQQDVVYYTAGNWPNFDQGGSFDCTHGFDLVEITFEEAIPNLLTEDGGDLLQENGGLITLP